MAVGIASLPLLFVALFFSFSSLPQSFIYWLWQISKWCFVVVVGIVVSLETNETIHNFYENEANCQVCSSLQEKNADIYFELSFCRHNYSYSLKQRTPIFTPSFGWTQTMIWCAALASIYTLIIFLGTLVLSIQNRKFLKQDLLTSRLKYTSIWNLAISSMWSFLVIYNGSLKQEHKFAECYINYLDTVKEKFRLVCCSLLLFLSFSTFILPCIRISFWQKIQYYHFCFVSSIFIIVLILCDIWIWRFHTVKFKPVIFVIYEAHLELLMSAGFGFFIYGSETKKKSSDIGGGDTSKASLTMQDYILFQTEEQDYESGMD